MANDPRSYTNLFKPCPPAYLGKSSAQIVDAQSDRQKFASAVGKAGDLQILNNKSLFGSTGSRVGQGMRTLASVSNSVRTGCGALPTVIGSAIGTTLDQGANWVLENVGFSKTVVDQARYFSPAIANQAYGQAQQLYQQVKQGNFSLSQIPNYLQDFQNLERLARNIYNPPSGVQSKFKDICEASPYAIDLALRAPKFKFLFLVQVIYSPGYSPLSGLDFVFAVKNSTLPQIDFETEDVNYYNFRSKYVTRTRFTDMQMTFYDDGLNYGTRFYNSYLRATTPISNLSNWSQLSDAENDGMNFDKVLQNSGVTIDNFGIPANAYTSTRGLLVDNQKTIIQEIRLYHLFDWGQKMNVYKFFNPRLSTISPGSVDMSIGSEANEFSMSFNYDSVYIDTDVPISSEDYNLATQQRGSFYIIKDVTSGSKSGPSNIGLVPEQTPARPGACNPGNVQNTTPPPTGPLISGGGIGGGIGQILG